MQQLLLHICFSVDVLGKRKMRVLIQRVSEASVSVNNQVVGKINKGFLVFIGIQKGDTKEQTSYLANKVSRLRIFEDVQGKMNLALTDVGGEILVISQFTLAGDMSRGNRPGFETAARPEEAKPLYEHFVACLQQAGHHVETGIFQADMKVSLINDGPSTFILEK